MLSEATATGLLVDEARHNEILGNGTSSAYVPPDPNAELHESLTGLWNVAEFIPKKHYDWKFKQERRRMNLYRRRTIPPGSLVHESAYLRSGDYSKRLPPDAMCEK